MDAFPLRIGAASWSVPARYAELMPHNGSHLQRYAERLNAVEINSSFYRPHRRKTYERWAASTPAGFSFSVKVPKAITHESRLNNCDALLDRFVAEVTGLGDKLGILLVQLPPSLSFDEQVAGRFVCCLRTRINIPTVLEPRHSSWFTPEVQGWLADQCIARVAADPSSTTEAGDAGGWDGIVYYRWHGSPRIYFSAYDNKALSFLRGKLDEAHRRKVPTWCIFDNTASGAALGNALALAGRI
jgi:uncharacterized protein YecE (DUF72 family)